MKEAIEDQRSQDNDRVSSKDHHPANIATEEEKETEYILQEYNRKKIDEIDAALKRIENKTYGICQSTGKKIIPNIADRKYNWL